MTMNTLLLVALFLGSQASVEAFRPLSHTTTRRHTGFTSSSALRVFGRKTELTDSLLPSFRFWQSTDDIDDDNDIDTSPAVTSGMPDLLSYFQRDEVAVDVDDEVAISSTSLLTTQAAAATTTDLEWVDGDDQVAIPLSTLLSVAALLGATALLATGSSLGLTLDDVTTTAVAFMHNPQDTLAVLIESIKGMGPAAPLYFGLLYCIAECLAIPATPLTLSAGYLFGASQGVAIVLTAGTLAACVGFFVGKTVLRQTVEGLLEQNPQFAKLDRAIGKEGFKLLVLVRLTPLFPFALSNYIYGASAIKFWPYFWGTLLGFTPGTIAYVYTGMVGQAVLSGQGSEPWYVYAGGMTALAALLKVISDTATGIVQTMEEEDEALL
jgi:uncharacterized membrane protein YdjX (TVP38/TMEM64 family)